jgi:CRP/FNR family transcriptional regulator
MTWSTAEIEDLVVRRPRLGIALVQLLVRRSMDFGARIESFSIDNIGRRLVRSLVRFSERLGRDSGDGTVDMMPFTHELLSQYVGTSREIVTHYMNQLRRQGYLRYSRKGIALNREALREWLKRDASVHEEANALRLPVKIARLCKKVCDLLRGTHQHDGNIVRATRLMSGGH